jgi:hypothetical protein
VYNMEMWVLINKDIESLVWKAELIAKQHFSENLPFLGHCIRSIGAESQNSHRLSVVA